MTQQTQLARLGLFDARVPRYTSYPTAPKFSGDISAVDHAAWIAAIPEDAQISLYIHVPFCRRLCWFCACRTQGTQSEAPVRTYLETLKQEIALLGRHLPRGISLSRLHWGGGTPTLLPADAITELADAILGTIPLAEGAEFSVEIDPNEIDGPRLDALAAAGMTRASIGVQDFDPHIQQIIGRIQSYDLTRTAADMIRARGIESLNADILYGLPDQTPERMTESVQKLMSLDPDRIALYGYAHVPWMARRQSLIPSDSLPTPQERLHLFETARELLLWDGYREIGIDHFARPDDGLARAQAEGRLRRNFQGYTDDTAIALVGLGASAISRFPQGYTQNNPATSGYTKSIRAHDFATQRGHRFGGEDLLRARMIEALMCDFAINSSELMEDFDVPASRLSTLFREADARFEGLLDVSDTGLRIPPALRPLTRMVARAFDGYEMHAAGHSPAV